MATFDQLLKASIGGSSFQLTNYTAKYDPIVKEGQGQIGTRVTISGEGYVESDTADAMGDTLSGVSNSIQHSHQDVMITGLGGAIEVQLLAARCIEGGPHITFEIVEDKSALVRNVKFTAVGDTAEAGKGNSTTINWKVDTVTRPDETQTITYTGEMIGIGIAGSTQAAVVAGLLAQYPASQWVRNVKTTTTADGDRANWQVSFTTLLEPLPQNAVDGEMTLRTTRDEKMRLVTELSYDLLVEGSPDDVINAIRPSGVVFRESVSVTSIKQVRIQATFSTLTGGNGNDLMDWDASIEFQTEDAPVKAITYNGVAPVLIRDEQPVYRVTYRGRATGAGRFIQPPAKLYPTVEATPKVVLTDISSVEKQTEWEHRYILTKAPKVPGSDALTFITQVNRPPSPQFLGATAPKLP